MLWPCIGTHIVRDYFSGKLMVTAQTTCLAFNCMMGSAWYVYAGAKAVFGLMNLGLGSLLAWKVWQMGVVLRAEGVGKGYRRANIITVVAMGCYSISYPS